MYKSIQDIGYCVVILTPSALQWSALNTCCHAATLAQVCRWQQLWVETWDRECLRRFPEVYSFCWWTFSGGTHTHTQCAHTHIACTHTVYTHSTHTHTHTCRASFLLGIWAIIDKVCNNVHDKVSVHYAGYTTSTASHLPLVVTPPITTSVSPGRVATRHSYRAVGMCSKMCQESIDGL